MYLRISAAGKRNFRACFNNRYTFKIWYNTNNISLQHAGITVYFRPSNGFLYKWIFFLPVLWLWNARLREKTVFWVWGVRRVRDYFVCQPAAWPLTPHGLKGLVLPDCCNLQRCLHRMTSTCLFTRHGTHMDRNDWLCIVTLALWSHGAH